MEKTEISLLQIQLKTWGFKLKEPDDHVVELWFQGKKLATYNQNITPDIIVRDCKNYLDNNRRELEKNLK